MRIRLSRLVFIVVPIIIIVASGFVVWQRPPQAPLALVGVRPAAAGCFAWGVNGAPNGTAPQNVCDQCAATQQCAATDGKSYWCGQCQGGQPPPPPPVPDKPGINPGPTCLGGSSRTVSLIPGNNSSNATFQIKINPSGQIVNGQSYTFTGLQQGVNYTFQGYAVNQYGNSGWSSPSAPVQQDTTPPTTTFTPVGTAGNAGWWRSNLTVTLPAVDSGCLGVKQTTYSLDNGPITTYTGQPFPVNGDGVHTLTYSSTDGTNAEMLQTQTIKIDTVPPTVKIVPDRPPDTVYGWYRPPVKLTIQASDATSGVFSVKYNLDSAGWKDYTQPVTLTSDLVHVFNVEVYDVAGNKTDVGLTVSVDGTPPTGTFGTNPPENGGDGYHLQSPVTVTLFGDDNLSGVAAIAASIDGKGFMYSGPFDVKGDGVHALTWQVIDKAGNLSPNYFYPIRIDTNPPDLVTYACNTTSVAPGGDFSITPTVWDTGSGIGSVTLYLVPPSGTPIQADSASWGPDVKSQQVVTLHFHPNPVQLGSYQVRLVLTARSNLKSTWDNLCPLSVSDQPTASPTWRFRPSRTPTGTRTPIYVVITNTPTNTPSDTPVGTSQVSDMAAASSTAPFTNTPSPTGDTSSAGLSATATATPTALVVAANLPPGGSGGGPGNSSANLVGSGGGGGSNNPGGSGPNNSPNLSGPASGSQPGNPASVTVPGATSSSSGPDLSKLLDAVVLAGAAVGVAYASRTSTWADEQNQQQEQEQQAEQARLAKARAQQAADAQANYEHNQAMQYAAQQVQITNPAPSDAWLAYEFALQKWYDNQADLAHKQADYFARSEQWDVQQVVNKAKQAGYTKDQTQAMLDQVNASTNSADWFHNADSLIAKLGGDIKHEQIVQAAQAAAYYKQQQKIKQARDANEQARQQAVQLFADDMEARGQGELADKLLMNPHYAHSATFGARLMRTIYQDMGVPNPGQLAAPPLSGLPGQPVDWGSLVATYHLAQTQVAQQVNDVVGEQVATGHEPLVNLTDTLADQKQIQADTAARINQIAGQHIVTGNEANASLQATLKAKQDEWVAIASQVNALHGRDKVHGSENLLDLYAMRDENQRQAGTLAADAMGRMGGSDPSVVRETQVDNLQAHDQALRQVQADLAAQVNALNGRDKASPDDPIPELQVKLDEDQRQQNAYLDQAVAKLGSNPFTGKETVPELIQANAQINQERQARLQTLDGLGARTADSDKLSLSELDQQVERAQTRQTMQQVEAQRKANEVFAEGLAAHSQGEIVSEDAQPSLSSDPATGGLAAADAGILSAAGDPNYEGTVVQNAFVDKLNAERARSGQNLTPITYADLPAGISDADLQAWLDDSADTASPGAAARDQFLARVQKADQFGLALRQIRHIPDDVLAGLDTFSVDASTSPDKSTLALVDRLIVSSGLAGDPAAIRQTFFQDDGQGHLSPVLDGPDLAQAVHSADDELAYLKSRLQVVSNLNPTGASPALLARVRAALADPNLNIGTANFILSSLPDSQDLDRWGADLSADEKHGAAVVNAKRQIALALGAPQTDQEWLAFRKTILLADRSPDSGLLPDAQAVIDQNNHLLRLAQTAQIGPFAPGAHVTADLLTNASLQAAVDKLYQDDPDKASQVEAQVTWQEKQAQEQANPLYHASAALWISAAQMAGLMVAGDAAVDLGVPPEVVVPAAVGVPAAIQAAQGDSAGAALTLMTLGMGVNEANYGAASDSAAAEDKVLAGAGSLEGTSSGWKIAYTTEDGDSLDVMTNATTPTGQPYRYGRVSDLEPDQRPTSMVDAVQKLADNVLAPGKNVETAYVEKNNVTSWAFEGLEKTTPIPKDPAVRADMVDANLLHAHRDVSPASAGDMTTGGQVNANSTAAVIRTNQGIFVDSIERPDGGWPKMIADQSQSSFVEKDIAKTQKDALRPILDDKDLSESQKAYRLFQAQAEANSKAAKKWGITDNFYQLKDGELVEVPQTTVYRAVQQHYKANLADAAKYIQDVRQFVNES